MINDLQSSGNTTFPAISINRVIVAWNTVNHFGQPAQGQDYAAGASIPGGGTSVGASGLPAGAFSHNNLTSGQTYFYKMWLRDPANYWIDGPVAKATSRTFPSLYVNEMRPNGSPDWIEVYNPGTATAPLSGYKVVYTDELGQSQTHTFSDTPPTINANAFVQLLANGQSGGANLVFTLNTDGASVAFQTPGQTLINDWRYETPAAGVTSIGRPWDGGPSGRRNRSNPTEQIDEACPYQSGLASTPGTANNTAGDHTRLVAASLADGNITLRWSITETYPPVWLYSPKQLDNFAMNVEGIAYRHANEMIIGLRSPLSGNVAGVSAAQRRGGGSALYYLVNDIATFLPTPAGSNPEAGRRMCLQQVSQGTLLWISMARASAASSGCQELAPAVWVVT